MDWDNLSEVTAVDDYNIESLDDTILSIRYTKRPIFQRGGPSNLTPQSFGYEEVYNEDCSENVKQIVI